MTLLPKNSTEGHKEMPPVKHNNHECDFCEKNFARSALLVRHKSQVHQIESQESERAHCIDI